MINQKQLHQGKKILIPLLYDYYMFSYYKNLVRQLTDDEFKVSVLTLNQNVYEEYSDIDPRIEVVLGPRIMRVLLNRSGKKFYRILLWFFGWFWGYKLKRKYDFVIVPWDNKPLWYIMTRCMPALSCHNSTEFLDFELTLEHMYLSDEQESSVAHKFWKRIDKILRGKLLPKVNSKFLNYSGLSIIDKIMGFRSLNYLHGSSMLEYLTVTGEKIKSNLHKNSLDPASRPKIVVTGSPSYEYLFSYKDKFDDKDRMQLFDQYEFDLNKRLYSFFLSPSSFTEVQIEEVARVVLLIREYDTSSVFIIKFHPKTRTMDPPRFREKLKVISDDLVLITEFGGDEFNAKIILSSECILQKQGTVGFIAMLYHSPLLSYDLVDTDYYDDMYERIGGSFHCKTETDILLALDKIGSPEGKSELVEKQKRACEDVCHPAISPCAEISAVIINHFHLSKES